MQTTRKATTSKLKLVFAGIGAGFCVVFLVLIVHALLAGPQLTGPSELALHPDRQDEILAKRKATELQEKLELTDDQTQKVTAILLEARKETADFIRNGPTDQMERFAEGRSRLQSLQDQIAAVLTPEQREKFQKVVDDRRERTGAIINLIRGQ